MFSHRLSLLSRFCRRPLSSISNLNETERDLEVLRTPSYGKKGRNLAMPLRREASSMSASIDHRSSSVNASLTVTSSEEGSSSPIGYRPHPCGMARSPLHRCLHCRAGGWLLLKMGKEGCTGPINVTPARQRGQTNFFIHLAFV